MIEDRIIQINEHGASRMLFCNQWIAREAPKRGLRDPWAHSPHRPIHTEEVLAKIAGVEVPATKTVYNECSDEELSAWKAERDEYMRQRDEWIALQMFNKYGYEQFCLECEVRNKGNINTFLDEHEKIPKKKKPGPFSGAYRKNSDRRILDGEIR